MTTNIATSKERLVEYLDCKGISNSDFFSKTGLKRGIIDKDKLHQQLTSDKIAIIIASYDDINIEWLITGNGDMLTNKPKASFTETETTTPLEIKPIGDFKVSEKAVDFQKVPLYELEATAGIFAQGDLTPYVIDYISIPNAPKCDGAILARGDSMEPIIKSGDLLLYKEHDINNIMYGHMYIVDFDLDGDSMIVVKYIKKDKDPKRIVLESENPRYQPMDIALEQVRHIAMVKVSVAFHTMI